MIGIPPRIQRVEVLMNLIMAMGFCRLLLEHGGLLMATMKHKSVYNAAVWL